MAHVLAALGTEMAWVVHGNDGLDEITIADSTFVAEARNARRARLKLRLRVSASSALNPTFERR
jgi:anthranilate phosphoribosyltransferase